MGRARSVARRSGKGKSEHRGHQRHQWRCAERRRVRLWLDGRAEGGKATAEGAVGCGLQQIAMASRALSDASTQNSPERWNVDWSPIAIGLGMAEQICSPYWNPWLGNVIGQVIEEVIPDLDRLNAANRNGPKLFVCATNVNKTALRIFRAGGTTPGEITPKTLMASTCLPTL